MGWNPEKGLIDGLLFADFVPVSGGIHPIGGGISRSHIVTR